ncbi:MAG: HTH domain-containing protein [Eubacterium sp.]|nr:HTH domain-containing protein [Eubacterium sp.]
MGKKEKIINKKMDDKSNKKEVKNIIDADNKQDEIRLRRSKIIKLLLEKNYTNDELAQLLNCKKRTIQLDIQTMNAIGFDIPKHKKNVGYALTEQQKEKCRAMLGNQTQSDKVYNHVVRSGVKKLVILFLINKSEKAIKFDELLEEYISYQDSEIEYDLYHDPDGTKMNNLKLSIKNICKELIRDGFIYYSEEDDSYTTLKNAPVLLNISSDECDDYLYSIKAFGSSYVLGEKLKSIEKKLIQYNNDYEIEDNDDYILVGNKMNNNSRVMEKLQIFDGIPYDKYAISICYKGNTIKVLVGLMVYAVDKDKLYIIGRVKKEKYKIIDMEYITGKIDVLNDIKNDLYESQEYLKIYNEMFSISTEPLEHVVVKVKNFGNLRRKFETLCDQRNRDIIGGEKRAQITFATDEFFVYEDDLRGLADFAKYLRRYGRAVEVIRPDKLKEMIIDDIVRLEEIYRKEGLYE